MFLLYTFVSDNFVNYYLFSKPHFCKSYNNRKKLNNKEGDIISIVPNNPSNEISKKSTIISFFIDESESNEKNTESNETNKIIENSKNIE